MDPDVARHEAELSRLRERVHAHGSAIAVVEDVKERVERLDGKLDELKDHITEKWATHVAESTGRGAQVEAEVESAHRRITGLEKKLDAAAQAKIAWAAIVVSVIGLLIQVIGTFKRPEYPNGHDSRKAEIHAPSQR